jgi:WD40 repeat protein
MTGFLKPVDPLPEHPELLSWGHLLPSGARGSNPRRIGTRSWVGGVAFQPTEGSMAIASDGVRVEQWRKTGPTLVRYGHRLPEKSYLSSIAYSWDGLKLVVGSYDHSATVFDAVDGTMLHTLQGHTGAIASVACSPGGFTATGSIDQTIRLWTADGKPHETLTGHKSWVNSVAFLNGATLVSGSSDGTIKLWDVTSGKCTKTLDATKAEVRCVAVSRDGKRLAAGLRYGVTKIWDTSNWTETVIEQNADDVWSVVFSKDGQQIVTAAGQWNRPTDLVFWDIASKKSVKTLRHTGEVMSLALSPDGKRLAAGGMDKAVSVWMLED